MSSAKDIFTRSSSKWVLGLFLVALALRAAFVTHHAGLGWRLHNDPGMYLALAGNIRHGVYGMFHPLDIPDTIKMPGYPALIHLLGGSVTKVLVLQVLLSSIKVPLVFLLAHHIGLGRIPSLGAAALMALEPMDILLSGQVLTETLFTTLVLAGTLHLVHSSQWRRSAWSALFFAAAAWVRPNGPWLIIMAGIAGHSMVHRSWPKTMVFILFGISAMMPWALRNQRVLDRFYLGDAGAVAAAYYQVPAVLRAVGDPEGTTWTASLHERASAMDWEDRKSHHAFFDDLRNKVLRTLKEHPLTWSRVQSGKAVRILLAPGRGHINSFFGERPWERHALLAWSACYSLLIVIALLSWLIWARSLPHWLWLFIALIAFIILTGALTTADARFKNPAMPLLIVGAAWSMERLLHKAQSFLPEPEH